MKKAPEGFVFPVLNDGTVLETVLLLEEDKDDCTAPGYLVEDNITPTLPILDSGEVEHTGWDIPTRYAVDTGGGCWMDDAHGGCLCLVTTHELLSSVENEYDRDSIRRALGLKPELPGWIKMALAAGWTPPEGFDISEYEEES